MQNIELRFTNFDNVTEENDGKLRVSGYVNEVGKFSHTLGRRKKFKEKITPGTFTRALEKGNDIHFLAEHDDNKILASTRNGSLQLIEDDKGLFMSAEISPTSYGRDYHTLINDGILRNMSFGFSVDKDKWGKLADGTYTREISDLTLYEVSVVTNPAYPQSSIQARGMALVDELEIPSDVEEMENTMEEVKVEEVKADEVVVEEVAEEKSEQKEDRAYIGHIWCKGDLMNVVLNVMADCTSMIQYEKGNPGKISEGDLEVLKKCVATCSSMIVGLNEDETAPLDEMRAEEKEDVEKHESTEEPIVEETKEEIVEETVEEEKVEETPVEESVEESVEEESKEDEEVDEEEKRSIDLSDYYKILENL